MKKQTASIIVQGSPVTVHSTPQGDYISLTDLAKCAAGESGNLVGDWLKNKNTLEYLGNWEKLYNAAFNSLEFDGIISASGVNRYTLSVKEWISKTGAIGILAKTGRYDSGTFAHEDIALDFAAWLSPALRLYVHKEFKRLKELEARQDDPTWTIRRVLSKANYRVHTDAVKEMVVPTWNLPPDKEGIVYADEAELLNKAVFDMTSQEWRKQNPGISKNDNIRDHADMIQLLILSNLESLNASYVREGIPRMERFYKLREAAQYQYDSLTKSKALAEQGKSLMKGLQPLDAPRPLVHDRPPTTGQGLKSHFQAIKDKIANQPPPPSGDKQKPKFGEVIERIVRVPPPKPDGKGKGGK